MVFESWENWKSRVEHAFFVFRVMLKSPGLYELPAGSVTFGS